MNLLNLKELKLEDYPLKSYDKIRFRDTDKQHHVNNAVFSTFLETGRVELLYNANNPLTSPGGAFVIASLKLELLLEIRWPGTVQIGSAITHVGNSSIQLVQGLYQNELLVATAETIIVQTDELTKKSKSLSIEAKNILNKYKLVI